MSLQVWLPLINNFNNYGLSDLKFSQVTSSYVTSADGGKVGPTCMYNGSHTDGGLISDKKIYLGTNLSIACWVYFTELRPDSALGGSMGGQHRYKESTGMGLTFKYVSSTTGYLSCNTGLGEGENNRTYNTYCGSTLLSANKWYHVCLTYDGSKIRLYVDGKLDGEHAFVGQVNVDDYINVFCWCNHDNSAYPSYKLIGYMNDFRVYDNTLSTKEVKEISKGLRIHYQFDSPRISNLISPTNFGVYNNYSVPASIVNTGETYLGCPVYRLTMTPNTTDSVDSFRGALHSHGVMTNGFTFNAGTKYCYWLYYRPVSHSDIRVGGTASNIHGWTEIPPESFGDGWYRVGQYRDGSVGENKSDSIFTSYYTPSAASGVPIIIDFCCPYLVAGTSQIIEPYGFIDSDAVEYDVSGYNHNAAIVGTISASADSARYKHSYYLNSSAYMRLPAMSYSGMGNSYTFAYWAKNSNMDGKMVWGFADGNRLNVYPSSWFNWNTGNGDQNPFMSNGANVTFTSYNGGWHHYAITGNGSKTTLYIDGVERGTAKNYVPITGTQIMISGWDTTGSYKWQGNVSDFRIYSTCLSAGDVAELYNTGASVTKNGVLFAYQFDEFSPNKKSGVNKKGSAVACGFHDRVTPTQDMKIKMLDDGSVWGRIHYLDVSQVGEYFANANQVAKCLDKANRYSRLGEIGKFKSQSTLPSGYSQLDYIEGTGTQHIDTGYVPNQKSGIEIDFAYTGTKTGTDVQNMFGARTNTTEGVFAMWVTSTNVYPHYGNTSYQDNGTFELATSARTIYKYNTNIASAGSAQIVCKEATFNSGYSLCLFTMKDSTGIDSRKAPGRLYGCKIYDDGRLIRNFIPCKTAAGVVGLYDTIGEKFYSNAGSGSFTAGAFVSKYEFMLTYPHMSATGYNRWSQTSDISASSVSGYTPISISWPEHSYGIRAHNPGSCIYNCDSGGTWYAPIGQLGHGSWNGTGSMIPAANGVNTSMMELWVRIDTCAYATQLKMYDGSISAADFIEI